MEDFEEYLNPLSRTFVQCYRCLSTSVLNKEHLDEDGYWGVRSKKKKDGYWVIMPPSALDRLNQLNINNYPMLFRIQNPSTESATHCCVLEFVAEEGFIHMPSRLMAHLGVEENELVLVKNTVLPRGTFIKLRPHTVDFLKIPDNKELLEYNFRKFVCLTAGETIAVMEGERRYYLDVLETQPADAVCTIDIDFPVDFATPLDYVEPPPKPAPATVTSQADAVQQAPQFTGIAAWMDGKPVEQPPPAPVPVGGRQGGTTPRQPVQFTGVAARMDGKPVEVEPPPPTPTPVAVRVGPLGALTRKVRLGLPTAASGAAAGSGVSKGKEEGAGSKEQEKRFTGTPYSLND